MRHMTAFVIALILSVTGMTLVTDDARAEGFVDVHIGGSFTRSTDGRTTINGVVNPSIWVDFKPGVSVGVRGGYWLDSFPYLGFALDLSYFDPEQQNDEEPVKLDVFPISALLMLRVPLLKSTIYPQGRLQPYVGAGPSAFVTRATAKVKPGSRGLLDNFSDTMVNWGLDARGGVNFLFAGQDLPGSLGVFLEYRYTRFEVLDLRDKIERDIGGHVPFKLELGKLDTHHIVVGVGYYF